MQTNTATPEMLVHINRFVAECQEMVDVAFASPHWAPPKLLVEYGKRYAKVVKTEPHTRSVYAFIDIATGDVLKAASWAAPAKHVRGNVKAHAKTCATGHGIVYLR